MLRHLCLLAALLTAAPAALAVPILPAGASPELDAQMHRHARQFYGFNAVPFGLSLDAHPPDMDARALIEQFLEQDETDDVAAVTGQHPYEILVSYGEYGDLGFFGGVALAGTAHHYMALEAEGAPEAELAQARERVVRAADAWHLFYVVHGGKEQGLVARGIRRMVKEFEDQPTLPVSYPEMVPLFDEDGEPLPQPKNNGAYRYDNSDGLLPEDVWIWKDSCSKDQLVGQVLGLVSLYDAMKDDPDIDQALVARLVDDALGVGKMLMVPRDISTMEGPVGTGVFDLIIMDADGRPTFHHDLNPLSLEKFYFDEETGSWNTFNLVMALGVMKGLHHVTGDPELEAFLYEELHVERDYLGKLLGTADDGAIDYIYAGLATNFDNPDMSSVALWLALYHETDPDVSAVLRTFLEERWWQREGESHTARLAKQPLWHAIYLGMTDQGTDAGLVDELVDLLLGFDLGPYWNDHRENCDAAEISAGVCVAIDGETELVLSGTDDDGDWMATEALHPNIRPPSNFNARSNPFQVNGGGGHRLNPGGDLYASYWMVRHLQATAVGEVNRSPNARVRASEDVPPDEDPPVAEPEVEPDAGTGGGDGEADVHEPGPVPDAEDDSGGGTGDESGGGSGGGGCAGGPTAPWWLGGLAVLALFYRREKAAA